MKSIPPLGSSELALIAHAVEERGEREVCTLLGISASTLSRALAGLSQQAGTTSTIRAALARLERNQEEAGDERAAREGSEEAGPRG